MNFADKFIEIIDGNEAMSAYVMYLASECCAARYDLPGDIKDLAGVIEGWLLRQVDREAEELKAPSGDIWSAAIYAVPQSDWLKLGKYYANKWLAITPEEENFNWRADDPLSVPIIRRRELPAPINIRAIAQEAWQRRKYPDRYPEVDADALTKAERILLAQKRFRTLYLDLILPTAYQQALGITFADEEDVQFMYCSFQWAGQKYDLLGNYDNRWGHTNIWEEGVTITQLEYFTPKGEVLASSPYQEDFIPGEFWGNFLAWLGQQLD